MAEYRKDLLELDDRGVSRARGVLSRLFRVILCQVKLSGPQWEMLMDRMLNDPRNPMPKNSKDRSSQKGNLNKALKGDRMTWKTFEKALRFLAIQKVKFIVEPTWANGRTTHHWVTQELGSFTLEDFEMTDSEAAEFLEQITAQAAIVPPPELESIDEAVDVEDKLRRVSKVLSKVGRMPPKRRVTTHDPAK